MSLKERTREVETNPINSQLALIKETLLPARVRRRTYFVDIDFLSGMDLGVCVYYMDKD